MTSGSVDTRAGGEGALVGESTRGSRVLLLSGEGEVEPARPTTLLLMAWEELDSEVSGLMGVVMTVAGSAPCGGMGGGRGSGSLSWLLVPVELSSPLRESGKPSTVTGVVQN